MCNNFNGQNGNTDTFKMVTEMSQSGPSEKTDKICSKEYQRERKDNL